MKTREEAAKFAEELMKSGGSNEKKRCWHFGKCEVRELMDFIYGGPPTCKEEEVFEPLRLRNAKVGKWRD